MADYEYSDEYDQDYEEGREYQPLDPVNFVENGGAEGAAATHQKGAPYGHIKSHADDWDQQGFTYSQCIGTKKALLIGINYLGSDNELKGCINDARNMLQFITEHFAFPPENIMLLTDDTSALSLLPTRENMIAGMQWLVGDAQPDDSLFFFFSGHGSRTVDQSGDEGDGHDEFICPVDAPPAEFFSDDERKHEYIIRPLSPSVRLTAIFDSCHSGTILDLPFRYTVQGQILGSDEVGLGNGQGMGSRGSLGDVVCWSGSMDEELTADAVVSGVPTGAMSYAFIAALQAYPHQSYMQLLNTLRDAMEGKYPQRAQLSSSHPIDTDLLFVA